jgi:DNA replication protein DnaC
MTKLFEWEKREAEKREAEKERMEKIIEKHNAQFFFEMIKTYFELNYGRFIYTESNKPLVKAVCYFLGRDARFETELNYSFKKGLLIAGSVGLGKTKIIKAVSRNEMNPISIYSIIDIMDKIKETGDFRVSPYCGTIMIDDIGSEDVVTYYGNQVNWFKDFLEKYYMHKADRFNRLIITTNLGSDDMERKYGARIRSRIREMFNTIVIQGPDLRN